MAEEFIKLHRHQGWAEVTINRPERRNAIIAPVSEALRDALGELAEDDSIAAILLRGEGGFFCSGIDLKALQADPPPPWRDRQGPSWRQLHLALFSFPKPVVGALEKYGINAGAALAFACDVLVSGETAFIQVGEIQQGAGAPMNMAWLKIKTSEQVAARLALYGDRVAGPELKKLGLVTECVPDDQVVSRSSEICKQFANFPPGATKTIKTGLIEQRGIDDPEAFFKQAGGSALLTAGLVK